jgi:hypothetical protein
MWSVNGLDWPAVAAQQHPNMCSFKGLALRSKISKSLLALLHILRWDLEKLLKNTMPLPAAFAMCDSIEGLCHRKFVPR